VSAMLNSTEINLAIYRLQFALGAERGATATSGTGELDGQGGQSGQRQDTGQLAHAYKARLTPHFDAVPLTSLRLIPHTIITSACRCDTPTQSIQ
jgi:hypothetical protein